KTGGLVVDVIANQLRDWPDRLELELANAILFKLSHDDRDVERLIGDPEEVGSSHSDPLFKKAKVAGQAAVHEWLRLKSRDGSRRILVTGDAGLGKSTVLRWLARTLCARFLSGAIQRDPLSLYIPMPQLELTNDTIRELRAKNDGIWPIIKD